MTNRYARREEDISAKRSTNDYLEFREMCQLYTKRTNIVSEGDSWFAYPPKWPIGKGRNIISFLKMKEEFNFYEMARIGDEIVDILSGDSKFDILRAVSENKVDFLLISGGGNDLVGEYDFEFILQKNDSGQKPEDFIRKDRFDRKISQIYNAYANLVDYCADYSDNPNIKIITHSYGYAIPIVDGQWMYPTLVALEIPQSVWRQLVVVLVDRLKDTFENLQKSSSGRFHYIDSTSLITDDDWIDEMHLKSAGFERVAELMYQKIKELRSS